MGQILDVEPVLLPRTVVSGTTASSTGSVAKIDLPSGYTRENTMIIGVKLAYTYAYFAIDKDIQITYDMDNNKLNVVVTNAAFCSMPIDVMITQY